MPTSRLFAYNTGSPISGTTQVGSIAISESPSLNYSQGVGGVRWWNGPNEDLGYVITHTTPSGTQPNRDNVPAYIGFWRSPLKTENSLITFTNDLFGTSHTTGDQCKTWLNANGYWTSWVGGSSFDPDAQAFFTAAGITDTTQKTAVNQLVLDLKSYHIWEKYSVIYPFVGGSSATCSYNLKNPSSYQITFYGGWTWDSNGIKSNVNSYGETGFSPSSGFISDTDYQYSIYSTTNGDSNDFFAVDMTSCDEYGYVASVHNLYIRTSSQLQFYDVYGGYFSRYYSSTNGDGLFTISRTNSTSYIAYRNGVEMTTVIGPFTNTGSRPVSNVVITGLNDPCVGISALGTIKNYAFWAMGNGLTSIESSNLYTAVQAFQTTLGRQV